MAESNVTPFPGAEGLPSNPLEIKPVAGFCTHDSVVLDDHSRTVQCANVKCGVTLDPYSFLRHQAQTIQRAWMNHRYVSQQAQEIAERVHALKKEEQRMRAMVKRLQEKSGAVVSVKGEGST